MNAKAPSRPPGTPRHVKRGFQADSDRASWHAAIRLLWMTGEFGAAWVDYRRRVKRSAPPDQQIRDRFAWFQHRARRLLDFLGVQVQTDGTIPTSGLLVCNHLSYVDILVLASVCPSVFVAKSDVQDWPLIGGLTQCAGTLFVRRDQRSDVSRLGEEMSRVMQAGAMVTLFPEGTSSGGDTVLPFHSALLAPAVAHQAHVTPACLHYRLARGSVSDEVCYWRDMTFLPHLFRLLRKRGIEARVRFGSTSTASEDRKILARRLHAEVLALHQQFDPSRNQKNTNQHRKDHP